MVDATAAMDKLVAEGKQLVLEFAKKDGKYFGYQTWFSRARRVVEQVLPERLDEFVAQYPGRPPTKEYGKIWTDFGIEEHLRGVIWGGDQPIFDHAQAAAKRMLTQYHILQAARAVFDDQLSNIGATLEAKLFDSELEAAAGLLEKGHLRAAGVVAGVVFEGHLKAICERKLVSIASKHPTLADYNDALKSAAIIEVPRWRKNQHLADLRNLCGHKKDREPTSDEVQELITGIAGAIKVIA